DRLGAARIGDTRELDHDAILAELLDHRLGDAKLVDALHQHSASEIDVAGLVVRDPVALVELQLEVHAALQVETELERNPGDHRVAHRAIGSLLAHLDVAREEVEHRCRHDDGDENEAAANRIEHRHSGAEGASRSVVAAASAARARTSSSSSCCLSAATPSNRRMALSGATHSILTCLP